MLETSCICMCRLIHGVTSYLQSRDVAHNVFMTRGTRFSCASGRADGTTHDDETRHQDETTQRDDSSTVRVYVWRADGTTHDDETRHQDETTQRDDSSTVRVYVWPRRSVYGTQHDVLSLQQY